MEGQELAQAFTTLNTTLGHLGEVLGAQGAVSQIEFFEGQPKQFRKWIHSIEKHAFLNKLNVSEVKSLAFRTSAGPVSNFIQRRLEEAPTANWHVLKGELSHRFAEVTDPQLPCARGEVRKYRFMRKE